MTIKERIIEALICFGAMDSRQILRRCNRYSPYVLNYSTIRARLADLVREGTVVKVDTPVPGGPALYKIAEPVLPPCPSKVGEVQTVSGEQFLSDLFGITDWPIPEPKRLSLWKRFINWLNGGPVYS